MWPSAKDDQTLFIKLLGQFRLRLGLAELDSLQSPKQQALLAYLLLHRHTPQARQKVAFLFWPDSQERQARANLRKLLHQLRKALPFADEFIHADRQVVRWRPDAPYTLDVAEFEAALEQSRERQGQEAHDALQRAITLYQGDLLPACYDDWIFPIRERLAQAYRQALASIIERLVQEERYQDAIPYTRKLIACDPLQEKPYRRLMCLYAQQGDRAAALKVYEEYTHLLTRELHVEPGSETKQLYEKLRLVDPSHAHRHNLPTQPTSFVGREQELAAVLRRLNDTNCRLLTLLGPAGIGKTRLALHAAQHVARDALLLFPQGIFFVSLAGLDSAQQLAPAIAQALNFHFYGRQPREQQLIDYLRHKELLLILDNFEQLRHHEASVDPHQLLLSILQQAKRVSLLVTSRERLQLREEWLLSLEGLPVPDTANDAASLKEDATDSMTLFFERARQIRPGFSLRQEGKAVARICRLVEGHPLAIELAAAWVHLRTPQSIAARIEQNGANLLRTTLRNVPERQRSIRAAIDHSWRLLTDDEQALFARLSVFPSSLDQKAAQAVAGATTAALASLAAKSIVRQRPDNDRFDLHELLRRYGAEKLARSPSQQAETRERHCHYFLDWLATKKEAVSSAGQSDVLSAIAAELPNINIAWHRAVHSGKLALLNRSEETLSRVYVMLGHFEEGLSSFETALAYLRVEMRPKTEPAGANSALRASLISRFLTRKADLLERLGRHDDAAAPLAESISLARASGRPHDLMPALETAGMVAYRKSNYAQAIEYLEEGLALSRALQDIRSEASMLTVLGLTAQQVGDYESARRHLEASLILRRRLDDPHRISYSLNNLGIIAGATGDYEASRQYLQECLQIRRNVGDRWGVAVTLNNLGQLARRQGALDEAQAHFQESLAIRRDFGNRWAVAIVLNSLGQVAFQRRSLDEAEEYFHKSLAMRQEIDDRQGVAGTLIDLGRLYVHRRRLQEGKRNLLEGLKMAMALEATPMAIDAVLGLAELASAEGDVTLALKLCRLVHSHPSAEEIARKEARALGERLGPSLPTVEEVAASGEDPHHVLQRIAERLLDA